jgi:isoquinoline 1-oxidoreductase alpha subunit
MTRFQVNGKTVTFEGPAETPLLWVLRDHLKLTGAKYGCGIGRCGACTVHVGGEATTSCTIQVGALEGAQVLTIEGLAGPDGQLHPVQQAWIDEDVPQCGYCQPGQIMTAVDLLARRPNPDEEEIARHMTNLCRCGTYVRIRKAIHRAAESAARESS